MTSTVLQWSGGKDSALALDRIQRESRRSVVELQTMFDETHGRSSWHGIRRDTLERQADALGVALRLAPAATEVDRYVTRMTDVFAEYRDRGIEYLAVGDIEEEDPDMPRERAMEAAGLQPFYPLLGDTTTDLVEEFLDRGFRATVVVVNGELLDESFVGRELSPGFIADLPAGVDVGGERGEYHTFVHDGPPFDTPLEVENTEVVTRTVADQRYHYGDLIVR